MSRYLRVLLRAGLILGWVVPIGHVGAANLGETAESKAEKAREYARAAVQSDIEGDYVYRDSLLSAALHEDPDCELVRWRSGYVRDGDGWISVDDRFAVSSRTGGIQNEYVSRRNGSLDRSSEEMKLANWCRQNQLRDVADIHFRRVADNSDNEMALRTAAAAKLGLRMISGKWASQKDVEEYRFMIRQAKRNLERWSGRVERWARDLHRPGSAKSLRASGSLRKIRDASAIPALELILSHAGETLASAVGQWNRLADGKTRAIGRPRAFAGGLKADY